MSNLSQISAAADYALQAAREVLGVKSLFVLTGAGISTDSGIPDYRGAGRTPKHPMTFDSFMGSKDAQVRYWARSFVGWSRIADAVPNQGHRALALAQSAGRELRLVTQNVDGLHQAAGSRGVIDLHGRLDRVGCLRCGEVISRSQMDAMLTVLNPEVQKDADFEFTPDGDAEIDAYEGFKIPSCSLCGGVLKPDVVFFGEQVPVDRVQAALVALEQSEAVLVAGSSLSVNSGLRFVRQATKAGKPVVIVNVGETKGDSLAVVKIEANTSLVLPELLA